MIRKLIPLILFLIICIPFIGCTDEGAGGGWDPNITKVSPALLSEELRQWFSSNLKEGDTEAALELVEDSQKSNIQQILDGLGTEGIKELGTIIENAVLVDDSEGYAEYEATITMDDGEVIKALFYMIFTEENGWLILDL